MNSYLLEEVQLSMLLIHSGHEEFCMKRKLACDAR
jgi:hypothetical protein